MNNIIPNMPIYKKYPNSEKINTNPKYNFINNHNIEDHPSEIKLSDIVDYINDQFTQQGNSHIKIGESFFTSICPLKSKKLYLMDLYRIYKLKDTIVELINKLANLGFAPKNISGMLSKSRSKIEIAVNDLYSRIDEITKLRNVRGFSVKELIRKFSDKGSEIGATIDNLVKAHRIKPKILSDQEIEYKLQLILQYVNNQLAQKGKPYIKINKTFFTNICGVGHKRLSSVSLQKIYKLQDVIVDLIDQLAEQDFNPQNISSMLSNARIKIDIAIIDLHNRIHKIGKLRRDRKFLATELTRRFCKSGANIGKAIDNLIKSSRIKPNIIPDNKNCYKLLEIIDYINAQFKNEGNSYIKIDKSFFIALSGNKLSPAYLNKINELKDKIVALISKLGMLGFSPQNISSMLAPISADSVSLAIDDLNDRESELRKLTFETNLVAKKISGRLSGAGVNIGFAIDELVINHNLNHKELKNTVRCKLDKRPSVKSLENIQTENYKLYDAGLIKRSQDQFYDVSWGEFYMEKGSNDSLWRKQPHNDIEEDGNNSLWDSVISKPEEDKVFF